MILTNPLSWRLAGCSWSVQSTFTSFSDPQPARGDCAWCSRFPEVDGGLHTQPNLRGELSISYCVTWQLGVRWRPGVVTPEMRSDSRGISPTTLFNRHRGKSNTGHSDTGHTVLLLQWQTTRISSKYVIPKCAIYNNDWRKLSSSGLNRSEVTGAPPW